jgi:hypothetical protein
MNLTSIRIENDVYLDKWIRTLEPLVNKNATYERFMMANSVEPSRTFVSSSWQLFLQNLGIIFGFLSIFESLIKKFWLPHTLGTYKKL